MPASDAFVKQLVPDAKECPEQAEEAVAQVFGRPVTQRPAHTERPKSRAGSRAGVGRRFVRSASSLFGIGDESKKGIALSDFAQQQPGERVAKRDDLDAGERTRILRMLRDEGGRQADEDSKVHRVDELIANYENHEQGQSQRGRRPNPLATLPPPSHVTSRPPEHLQPLQTMQPLEDRSAAQRGEPKQAVIVGLAKATSERKKQQRPQFEPVMDDERTEHLSAAQAEALLSRAGTDNPFGDEATNFVDFDPKKFLEEAEKRMKFTDEGSAHEDATRVAMIPDDEFTPTPRTGLDSRDIDFSRNAGDEHEPRSLSEVDWDLD